jgi:aminopeptidase
MYTPSPEILKKYASVLVNFALNDGEGIKKNDVVLLSTQTPGIPLAKEIYRTILQSGGHPLLNIMEDDFKLIQLSESSDEQLSYFPNQYYTGLAQNVDHLVRVLADRSPLFLASADPRKVIIQSKSTKPYRDMLDAKEDQGKFSWTLCLYGTEGVAKEAGLTEEEYWQQIEQACFLRDADPITTWKKVNAEIHRVMDTLNDMQIATVNVKALETDMTVSIGENRQWLGGRGRNIPSFEIFTSPDWRGINGTMFFDLPLYRYGQIIRDIRLEIKNGLVVKATAKHNEKLLLELIAQENANKIGEFSLTDKRFSKINKFMAETLFDENFGGEFGNTHMAVGKSYHDTCTLDTKVLTDEMFANLGFNDSPEHTDIIATSDRTVTATLKDGSKKVIYEGGEFTI